MKPTPTIPNPKTLLLMLAGMILLQMPAFALLDPPIYHVSTAAEADDSNDGSEAHPWRTLAKVNSINFLAGDQILFKRGCAWSGNLYPHGSGTSTNRIVFGAYGPETDSKPIINGTSAFKAAVQIWAGRSYITVRDFKITNDGDGEGTRMGFYISLGQGPGVTTGIQILNNEICNIKGYSYGDFMTSTAAIYVIVENNSVGNRAKFDDLLIEGNYIHDTTCVGLYFKGANWTSIDDTTWWSTRVAIKNNTFDKLGADGVVLNACLAPLVEGNACFDAGLNAGGGHAIAGLWTCVATKDSLFQFNEVARTRNSYPNGLNGDSQAFDVDIGTIGNHTFQYNYTHDNDGGILIVMPKQDGGVDYVKTTVFRYNLCVNDGRSTNSSSQFPVYPVPGKSDAFIYNNVFYSTRPEGFRTRENSATYFYNNIFYAPQGIYTTRNVFSNNCYWGHTANVTDPAKLVADPKFVGPFTAVGLDGDDPAHVDMFKLLDSSPCINAGRTVSVPVGNGSQDFYMNPLYAGAPDIGIHEVVGGSRAVPAPVAQIDDPAGTGTSSPGGNWAVSYTGGSWVHTPGQADFFGLTKSTTDQVNHSCQVTFTGTNISLYGRKFNNAAKLNVYLDGAPTPVAVVDCYSPVDMWRTELSRLTGLSNGAHTVKYTVAAKNPVSAGTYVSLDYFQIAPIAPPALPVVTDLDDTAGTYTGTWTAVATNAVFYGKTYHKSSTTGASVVFNFTGTGVRLLGTRAADCGKVNISIDNGPAVQRDLFLPISFGGSEDFSTLLFETNGLSNTTHTLRATVDASANPQATGHKLEIDSVQGLVGGSAAEVVVDNALLAGVVYYGGGTWGQGFGNPLYFAGTSAGSITLNSYVTFTFTGTGASIYGNVSPNGGRMNVSIDGGTAVPVDTYAATLAYQSQLYSTSGLSPGSHTLTATVIYKNPFSGGNWITLDFFKYQP